MTQNGNNQAKASDVKVPKVNLGVTSDIKMPEGFLWGVGVSAHQVEGDNVNDWSEWEKSQAEYFSQNFEEYYRQHLTNDIRFRYDRDGLSRFKNEYTSVDNFVSGRAIEHYKRYEDDLKLLEKIGVNLYRFSIEWSRIEPEEGVFNQEALDYYKKYLATVKDKNIQTMVTLWHWTMPVWLAKKGGTSNSRFVFYFERFVEQVVSQLADQVDFWLTLNEPTIYSGFSYFSGIGPVGKKNFLKVFKSFSILAKAHNRAYDVIKKHDPTSKVSLAHHALPVVAHGGKLINRIAKKALDWFFNEHFIKLVSGKLDFLGLNNYVLFEVDKFQRVHKTDKVSDLAWELTPESVYHMLNDYKKYNLPIIITENGVADHDDDDRVWYIEEVVKNIAQAQQEGIDVQGYVYWSFIDNFEWDKGFWPRFGLVEVDYKTMARKMRPSAAEFRRIIQDNGLKGGEPIQRHVAKS